MRRSPRELDLIESDVWTRTFRRWGGNLGRKQFGNRFLQEPQDRGMAGAAPFFLNCKCCDSNCNNQSTFSLFKSKEAIKGWFLSVLVLRCIYRIFFCLNCSVLSPVWSLSARGGDYSPWGFRCLLTLLSAQGLWASWYAKLSFHWKRKRIWDFLSCD